MGLLDICEAIVFHGTHDCEQRFGDVWGNLDGVLSILPIQSKYRVILSKLVAQWWSLSFLLPLLLCANLGCLQRYERPLVPAPRSDDGDTDAEHQGGVVAADELH